MEPKKLDCPKCVGKLEAVGNGQPKLDVCFICSGIWFDGGELEKVLKVKGGFFENFGHQAVVFSGAVVAEYFDAQAGRCPRCAGSMVQRRFKGTTIDCCAQNHGIWLDDGELKNVVIHDLRIKYGIFWVLVFVVLLALNRGRNLRLASKSPSFGGGLAGGGGASGSF